MKFPLALLALSACVFAGAAEPKPVRVLVWDEQQQEQKKAYGEKFLGETMAAHLDQQPGFTVKSTNLNAPEQGLDEATLDATDVIVWWGHQKNPALTNANAVRWLATPESGR